jgi:predicted PurR-regulated permease PerM
MTQNPDPDQNVPQSVATVVRADLSQTRTVLRVITIVLAVAATIWLLHALKGVLVLVVLAIFFAYILSPLVAFVQRLFKMKGSERNVPRAAAIGIVYLVIFGCMGIAIYLLLPRLGEQITQFARQAPEYLITARGRAQILNDLYQQYQLPPSFRETLDHTVSQAMASVEQYVIAEMTNIAGWIAYIPWLVLIPIIAFFLLKDSEGIRHSALMILPRGRMRWRGDEFFQDVNSTLAAYIRAQLTACLLIGVICLIGFYIIGVPYPLLLAVIAGLLEFIPLVGWVVVAILATFVTSLHSFSQSVWVIVFLLVLRLVEDYLIYPRLIGRGIHLHPLEIILAALCGAELGGILGVFLSIPTIAILSVGYRHWLEHRGSEGLVADLLKPAPQVIPTSASSEGIASETATGT